MTTVLILILVLFAVGFFAFVAWDCITHPSTPESREAWINELDDYYREQR